VPQSSRNLANTNANIASMGALMPYKGQYASHVISKYDDFKAMIEEEYDKEIKND